MRRMWELVAGCTSGCAWGVRLFSDAAWHTDVLAMRPFRKALLPSCTRAHQALLEPWPFMWCWGRRGVGKGPYPRGGDSTITQERIVQRRQQPSLSQSFCYFKVKAISGLLSKIDFYWMGMKEGLGKVVQSNEFRFWLSHHSGKVGF